MSDEVKQITRAETAASYRAFLDTEDGRVVLADLVRRFAHVGAGLFQPEMDKEPVISAAKRDGHREVLIYMNKMMEGHPSVTREPNDEPAGDFHGDAS